MCMYFSVIFRSHVKHKPTEQVFVQNQMTVAGLVPWLLFVKIDLRHMNIQ